MAKPRQNSNQIIAFGSIKAKPKGGYLLWVKHPDNSKLVGFPNYRSVAEAIEQRISNDIIDAVGTAELNTVNLKLTFQNDFETFIQSGRELIELDSNRPQSFEIVD